jgi:hypothetical protein
MNNILFCHGYATKNVIMKGIQKLKKLICTNNIITWGIARSPRLGILGSNLISE